MAGAIFARGSCRALRWMALFGVVFALGVGQAAAQVKPILTVSAPGAVDEGDLRVPVSVRLQVPAAPAGVTRTHNVMIPLELSVTTTPAIMAEKMAELTDTPPDVVWEAGGLTLSVEFTNVGNARYDRTETRYLTIGEDADAEDEYFVVMTNDYAGENTTQPDGIEAIAADAKNDVAVMIDDEQTQLYTLLPKNFGTENTIKEGGTLELELEADPPRTVAVTLEVTLESANDDSDYGLAGTSSTREDFTIPEVGQTSPGKVEVVLGSEANDIDRVDDTVTLTTAYAEGSMRGQTVTEDLEVTVLDQHKLPEISRSEDIEITDGTKKSMVTMLMEGQMGTVKLLADRSGDGVPDSEDITVELSVAPGSTASAQDYRLDDDEVELKGTAASGTFVLDVLTDEDIGEETLVLMATVAGDKAYGTETTEVELDPIVFDDDTTKKIEPKGTEDGYAAVNKAREEGAGANGLWNPGETMTLKAADLFDWPATTTSVVLGSILVEDTEIVSASASNDMVTITAREPGMTEVSISATVVTEASSFEGSQTLSNTAKVKFPVTVDPYTITAMSDMDVQAAADAAIAKAAAEAASKQWEPNGATAMVPLSELFDVPDEVTPTYQAESSDMGDVEAGISSDKMYVSLMPKSAGNATITVTAVDLAGGTVTSVKFDAMVMAPTAIVAKTQAEVDAVFMKAGAGMLMAGGAAVMVPMDELFTVTPGVKPTYSADSDMTAVITASDSGMTATLTPLTAGEATITVTAFDSVSGTGVTVSSMVTVDSESLVVMLEMPEGVMDGNIVEGMSYDIKVTANRAVTEDTEVMIMRDRAASYADDDDFEVSSAMIMTGESSATATLMVKEDMEPDAGHADGEMLVLYGTVNGESTNSLMFTIWDEAVPALPLFGQLLLALFLMLGGARLYRRRQG